MKQHTKKNDTVYIEFLNKAKNFQRDKVTFPNDADAEKWAKANLGNFNPDMIRIIR